MGFKFFKKKEVPVRKSNEDNSAGLSEEALAKVDGGYQKTQDDINKILAESDYINELQKDELAKMLSEEKNDSDEKGYLK